MSAFKTFAASLVVLALAAVASACPPYSSSCYDNCYSGNCYSSNYCYDNCYTPSYAPSYTPTYTPFHSCSYSSWSYDSAHSYYYCTCSFRANASCGWSKYYCIYSPSCGNCVYYFNPVTKLYWGRYDEQAKGFAVLPAASQKAVISELPQDKFAAPAAALTIPGSQVAEQLPSPPDLPSAAATVSTTASTATVAPIAPPTPAQ